MSLPSPYAPGELPRVLGGRTTELASVRDRLSRVHTYGEMSPPLVLHAPRGLGKTTVLRESEQEGRALGFVPVWVSCAKSSHLLAEIAAAVARALAAADLPRGRRRARAVLSQVGVDLGVPGLMLRADLDLEREPTAPAGDAPIGALERLLGEAASLVRDAQGAGLLLLVDELHAARFADLGVLLNALQNLAGRRAEHPLAVLGAGLPSTPEMLSRAATFGERTRFVTLQRLERADATTALVAPAGELGVAWEPRALAAALDVADGFPYDLQLVGQCTWEAAGPSKGDLLSLRQVRSGQRAMRQQRWDMCRARYASATPVERRFLEAMASLDPTGGAVRRSDIAAAMGRPSTALSMHRARLIDEGVIEPADRGLLRFTLPGMRDWIRGEVLG